MTEQSSSKDKKAEIREEEDEQKNESSRRNKDRGAKNILALLLTRGQKETGSENYALFVCIKSLRVLIASFKLNRGCNRL